MCVEASPSLTSSGLMTETPSVPYKLLLAVTEFNEIFVTLAFLVLSALSFKSHCNSCVDVTTVYTSSSVENWLISNHNRTT